MEGTADEAEVLNFKLFPSSFAFRQSNFRPWGVNLQSVGTADEAEVTKYLELQVISLKFRITAK